MTKLIVYVLFPTEVLDSKDIRCMHLHAIAETKGWELRFDLFDAIKGLDLQDAIALRLKNADALVVLGNLQPLSAYRQNNSGLNSSRTLKVIAIMQDFCFNGKPIYATNASAPLAQELEAYGYSPQKICLQDISCNKPMELAKSMILQIGQLAYSNCMHKEAPKQWLGLISKYNHSNAKEWALRGIVFAESGKLKIASMGELEEFYPAYSDYEDFTQFSVQRAYSQCWCTPVLLETAQLNTVTYDFVGDPWLWLALTSFALPLMPESYYVGNKQLWHNIGFKPEWADHLFVSNEQDYLQKVALMQKAGYQLLIETIKTDWLIALAGCESSD